MDLAESDAGLEIAIEVVFGRAPHAVDLTALILRAGSTAAEAVRASGVLGRHGLDVQAIKLGVWGRICAPDQVLRAQDRVEIYRPLLVDPKEARRLRYKKRPKP